MDTKWGYRIKELLTFSKKERVGFIALLLIVMAVLLYSLLNSGHKDYATESFEELTKAIDSTEARHKPDNSKPAEPFLFDPNTADSATFVQLGFTPNQVKSILAYRSTGAWFSVPNDFSKLYVVSDDQFQRLKPYIKIAQPSKPFKKVELNTADTTELQRLRGIGPYYARQIARYREHLGGFHSAVQLKEIKGIDDERFSLFASQYTLDAKHVKQLNLNMVDEKALKAHPYIGSEAAGKIVKYRQQTAISSMEELLESGIFTDEAAGKLSPYLTFD